MGYTEEHTGAFCASEFHESDDRPEVTLGWTCFVDTLSTSLIGSRRISHMRELRPPEIEILRQVASIIII